MYLDSANLNEIIEAKKSNIIKGITTNPTLLLKEGKNREQIIQEILDNISGKVFVQVAGNTIDKLYKSTKEILKISKERIVLKVPINSLGLKLINELKYEKVNIPILGTAIFSADQAIIAGLAGCEYIAPYVNRMENNNINPFDVIKKTRHFYDDRKLHTQILSASFKNNNQVIDSLVAGAHTATVPFDIYQSMIDNQLASMSIDVFNNHDIQLYNKTGE